MTRLRKLTLIAAVSSLAIALSGSMTTVEAGHKKDHHIGDNTVKKWSGGGKKIGFRFTLSKPSKYTWTNTAVPLPDPNAGRQ